MLKYARVYRWFCLKINAKQFLTLSEHLASLIYLRKKELKLVGLLYLRGPSAVLTHSMLLQNGAHQLRQLQKWLPVQQQISGQKQVGSSYFSFFVIFFPKWSVFSLTRHVKRSKVNFTLWEVLYFKADSCTDFNLLVLFWLKQVDHSWLSRIVQSDNNDAGLFASPIAHFK